VVSSHSISFFSWFVFDEFIARGGSMGTKLVELLLIGWLREET
jgi:hypothetical protein